jgi:hypothetical protein
MCFAIAAIFQSSLALISIPFMSVEPCAACDATAALSE